MDSHLQNIATRRTPRAPILIPKDNIIRGDLIINGRIQVEGQVFGAILINRSLSVGRTGFCEGDSFRSQHILVSGTIRGDVYCESLLITRFGRVIGNIHCQLLTIEKGGLADGSHQHLSESMLQQF